MTRGILGEQEVVGQKAGKPFGDDQPQQNAQSGGSTCQARGGIAENGTTTCQGGPAARAWKPRGTASKVDAQRRPQ